ncbi:MAG: SDR family NAD(P)-dependent oxidoreductase [Woeseiaceae bacterium]|nr:SDR family NAD(P)-dependent oxidoreductase [Woeseiaceae bacterium]
MSFFAGKHAVVTGGGSGIGAAIAAALAQAGCDVTVMGRSAAKLDKKAKQLGTAFEVADVTDRKSVAAAFASASDRHGAVAILVNNAGAAEASAFAKMDDALWDSSLAVNLTGVYNCTRAVIGDMLKAGSGRVVNIASTAALKGYAYVSAYCAAKHGVVGLTRALALEYANKGITVNAVCPGYTNTEIVDRAIEKIISATGRGRDEALAELTKVNPQGRLVEPDEVADTVLWVCRQASINGQSIAVAGGEVM